MTKDNDLKLPPPVLPRLFRVEVTYEVLVLAHSRKAAEEYVLDGNVDDMGEMDAVATKATKESTAQDWFDSLPYIADDVKDPEYRKDAKVDVWFDRIKEEDDQRRAKADMDARQVKLPGV